MWTAIILICLSSMDRAECTIKNAYDQNYFESIELVQGPSENSMVTCMMHGQAYVAELGLDFNDRFVKVYCRSSKTNGNG